MNALRIKDIAKLAEMLDMDGAKLTELSNIGLINMTTAKKLLARFDYRSFTSRNEYYKNDVLRVIGLEYGMTVPAVRDALNMRANTRSRCDRCGTEISSNQYMANGGLCTRCHMEKLREEMYERN